MAALNFCVHTKISSSYLHDTFHYAVDITSRIACNALLFVPMVITTLAKNSFCFHGTHI